MEAVFEELRQHITCNICVRPLYEPYTIHCGHTFCYSCLVAWFKTNRNNPTCPECRMRVREQPAPCYSIREMTRLVYSRPELLPDGENIEEHATAQAEEARHVEKDKDDITEGGLFPGCFHHRHHHHHHHFHPAGIIHDLEDGVDRCPSCSWELINGYCEQCDEDWFVHADIASMTDSDDFSADLPSNGSDLMEHILVHGDHWSPGPARHPPVARPQFDLSDSDDYDSEDDDVSTDLGGFIEDDGRSSSSDVRYLGDGENTEHSGPAQNPEWPPHSEHGHDDHDDHDSDQTRYDDDEPGSLTEQYLSEEPAPFSSDSEDMEQMDRQLEDALSSSDSRDIESEDLVDSRPTDHDGDDESDNASPVNLAASRSGVPRSRKRRRVIDDDEDESDEAEMETSRPRSWRRLNSNRDSTDVGHSSDESESITIGHRTPVQPARQSNQIQGRRRSRMHAGRGPPANFATTRRPSHRPVAQAFRNSPRGRIVSGSSANEYAIRAAPPTAQHTFAEAHLHYHNFVSGWMNGTDPRPTADRGYPVAPWQRDAERDNSRYAEPWVEIPRD